MRDEFKSLCFGRSTAKAAFISLPDCPTCLTVGALWDRRLLPLVHNRSHDAVSHNIRWPFQVPIEPNSCAEGGCHPRFYATYTCRAERTNESRDRSWVSQGLVRPSLCMFFSILGNDRFWGVISPSRTVDGPGRLE